MKLREPENDPCGGISPDAAAAIKYDQGGLTDTILAATHDASYGCADGMKPEFMSIAENPSICLKRNLMKLRGAFTGNKVSCIISCAMWLGGALFVKGRRRKENAAISPLPVRYAEILP